MKHARRGCAYLTSSQNDRVGTGTPWRLKGRSVFAAPVSLLFESPDKPANELGLPRLGGRRLLSCLILNRPRLVKEAANVVSTNHPDPRVERMLEEAHPATLQSPANRSLGEANGGHELRQRQERRIAVAIARMVREHLVLLLHTKTPPHSDAHVSVAVGWRFCVKQEDQMLSHHSRDSYRNPAFLTLSELMATVGLSEGAIRRRLKSRGVRLFEHPLDTRVRMIRRDDIRGLFDEPRPIEDQAREEAPAA